MSDFKKSISLPEIENNILSFWDSEDIFAKTVNARKDAEPYVFYDGPPFTTGLPHYGHIMQMANKDAVIRYKTMQGFNVPRTIGWDTHGLPVEYELEKELGLKGGKRAIEEYGIEKFVEAARGIVLRAVDEWKGTMKRMGRWVDTSHPYKTMDNDYIESVWWAFKTLYEKGLVYKDFRVSPYCPRCGTVLSNFEVNQGYQDNVPDPSVFVAFPLKDANGILSNASLLVWTTTPWTLPSNAGVAVNASETYNILSNDGRNIVVHEKLGSNLFPEATVVGSVLGADLVGLTYEPPYLQSEDSNAYKVVDGGADVSSEEGTGLLHVAPAYGEFDSQLGKKNNLPLLQSVDPDGTVTKGKHIPGEGKFVKEADGDIMTDLHDRGILIKKETIRHTYPFCWRCDSPLLYMPITSWYIQVTKIKDKIIAENKKIAWQPEHFRDGRFGRWLDSLRDWAVSRDRYWGAPLPIWECKDCGAIKVLGSREELGVDDSFDLHRPYIDEKVLPCECGKTLHRVPFVFDCWFESGSMPFAQHHYPFENKMLFNAQENIGFPADFIAEGLDQTRGWFYSLHALGVALFDKRAYNNVVITGLILAADGKKLSKRLRNYVDPNVLFESEGVDALRLFLFTAASLGEDYRFTDKAVADVKRRWITPLLNVLEYYKLSLAEKDDSIATEPHYAELDKWMKARVAEARAQVSAAMEGSESRSPNDLVRACRTFGPLVEDLSTWYVRLSRGRKDVAFIDTLNTVLTEVCKTYAPFIPFVTEHIYQSTTADNKTPSVHMCLSNPLDEWMNSDLLEKMENVRKIVSLGRELRAKNNLPLRQPLGTLELRNQDLGDLGGLVAEELQVQNVRYQVSEFTTRFIELEEGGVAIALDPTINEHLRQMGQANMMRRIIQDLRKQANLTPGDKAQAVIDGLDSEIKKLVQEQLLSTQLVDDQPESQPIGESEFEGNSIRLYI